MLLCVVVVDVYVECVMMLVVMLVGECVVVVGVCGNVILFDDGG